MNVLVDSPAETKYGGDNYDHQGNTPAHLNDTLCIERRQVWLRRRGSIYIQTVEYQCIEPNARNNDKVKQSEMTKCQPDKVNYFIKRLTLLKKKNIKSMPRAN